MLSRTYPQNHLCTCHLLEASEHTLSLKHMSSARWTVQCLWCVLRFWAHIKDIGRSIEQMTCALCSLRFAGCFFIFKFLFKNYWFAAIFRFCQKFPFLLVAFSFSNPFEKYFETYWFAVFFWRFGRNFDLCLLQSNLQMTCALCSLRFAEHFFHFRFLCKKYWFEAFSNLYSEKIFLTSCFIGRFWLPLCVLNVLCMCQV